jgi:hypothetical protein
MVDPALKLREADFTYLCNQFRGTVFEEIFNMLNAHYALEGLQMGRLRLMKSDPRRCYTWHIDKTPRIHYPIKTQEGCLMVIDDEVIHMPADKWVWADTVKPHTAFNGSMESRIHLVGAMIPIPG